MQLWLFNPFDDLPWEGKPQRFATLARCLAEQGHTVVYWSSDFSHRLKTRRVPPEQVTSSSLPYTIELIPTPPYRKNISLQRIRNHRCYGKRLVKIAKQKVADGELQKPDLILASMPPLEGPIAALKLKKQFGCKVVMDVMDAWPATLLQAMPGIMADSKWRIANYCLRAIAQLALIPYAMMLSRACREADAISAQSKQFADFAIRNGATDKPIHVCLLGAERFREHGARSEGAVTSNVSLGPATADESQEPVTSNVSLGPGEATPPSLAAHNRPPASDHRSPGKLRLLYLGAMGRSYDLETLLDAVEKLNADSLTVELVLVGDGEKRTALENRKVPGVTFTGYLHGSALDAEMRQADLGIVPFFPQSGVAVPYKAGDYLSYNLPLLSTLPGELAELIAHYECGQTYTAGDPETLLQAILPYIKNPTKLETEKANAQRCFEENLNREKTYPLFCNWLCDAIG